MNILYLADPNSIHDIKWMSFFSNQDNCFLLPRMGQYEFYLNSLNKDDILGESGVRLLTPIRDFSIVRLYRTINDAFCIRRIIRRNNINAIHILYCEPNALWCLFRVFFSVPMIISARGTDVLKTIPETFGQRDILNLIVSLAYRLAFRSADWITTTSQAQIAAVNKFSGQRNRLSIVRTGVDIARINSDTSKYFPLTNSQPYLLFPRYFKPLYNHQFSLSAITKLPKNVKTKYKMVFVGRDYGDAAYQKELELQMAQQSDVEFEFIGKQSQEAIFELYKRASAVIMTPLSDGSPVSGMEALLCGAKLILGPLNYDADLFSQAIRMRTWDANELARLITQALDDPERPQLSAETIAAMDRETNMQKMMQIYESLMEGKEM